VSASAKRYNASFESELEKSKNSFGFLRNKEKYIYKGYRKRI
jgi:hypothetical protein